MTRATHTTCFETFPFPEGLTPNIPAAVYAGDQRAQAIATSAHDLFKQRTLTNLYNSNPAWLTLAHETLDKAVAAAYGWNDYVPDWTDAEILRRLLALNKLRSTTP